jgi:hypothetical protein
MAPLGILEDVDTRFFVVGKCDVLPALWWTGPGSAKYHSDVPLLAILRKFDSICTDKT